MPDGRCDELQHLRIRVRHVVSRCRVVTAGEQYPGAVEERLPAYDDEFVADVPEKSPRLWRGAYHEDNRTRWGRGLVLGEDAGPVVCGGVLFAGRRLCSNLTAIFVAYSVL